MILVGVRVVIVEMGLVLKERLRAERVGEDDIMAAAREQRGLRKLDEIDYAVLEQNGHISIIPKKTQDGTGDIHNVHPPRLSS
jgi:uncharacterized membrane protein YcaP (DUF421 family)